MSDPSPRWTWTLVVWLAAFTPLAATINDPGEIWDEPVYLEAVDQALGWFDELATPGSDPFSPKSLHERWRYGRFGIVFHPPGGGYPAMVVRAVAGRWLAARTCARLATACQLAGAAALAFHFLSRRASVPAGLFAAGALVTMPRVFGEGHLFATDVPAMFWWAVSAVLFWKCLEPAPAKASLAPSPEAKSSAAAARPPRRWPIRLGFALASAYAFLVKPTAVMVLLPIVAWSAVRLTVRYRRSDEDQREMLGREGWRVAVLSAGLLLPLISAGATMLALADGMRSHAERGIIAGMNAELAGRGDLPREMKEELIRREMVRWLAFVDLLDPGVTTPSGGPGLLLLPALLWLVRAGWLQSGKAPTLLRPGSDLAETWWALLAWAPAFVWLLGPCWWTDSLVRLAHYLSLNFQRQGALPDIEILYWGKKYVYSLPWHNGWVLLALTLPVGTLALAGLGALVAAAGRTPGPVATPADPWPMDARALGRFLLANAVTLPVLRMLGTPAHDGVRLMMPAMFFVAALAGIGFVALLAGLERWAWTRSSVFRCALAGGLLVPGVYGIAWSHPYELSYYNRLIGQLAGAQRAGFEVTYWYDPVNRPALVRIREVLPEGATLAHHQHVDVFSDWEAEVLRPKIRTTVEAPPARTYFGLLTHGSKSNPTTRLLWGMQPFAVAAECDGVRLYSVYAPAAAARATALTMLVRARHDEPAPEGPAMRPAELSAEVLELARTEPDALREAARFLEEAIASNDGEPTLQARMAGASLEVDRALQAILGPRFAGFERFRQVLAPQLAARPTAIQEAAAILTARPDVVERLVASGYYPPDDELAPALDAGLD